MFPLTREEMIKRLRASIRAAGSQTAWADKNHVWVKIVRMVLSGQIVHPDGQILRPLGLIEHVSYLDVEEVKREEAA